MSRSSSFAESAYEDHFDLEVVSSPDTTTASDAAPPPASDKTTVTPDQYSKLAGQLKRSWQAAGVPDSIVGVSIDDRANALARQLDALGVKDLEKLGTGSISRYIGGDAREPAGKEVDWKTYKGAPYETYSFVSYEGKPIGYIRDPSTPSKTGTRADPYGPPGVGVLDLWDPAGKGHIKFIPTAGGPGGLIGFNPQWDTSSDLPQEAVALIGTALTLSGVGTALGAAITSSLGVAATAATNAFIGNTIMQTVVNGGDIGSALKSSIASWAGAQVGDLVGKAAGSMFSNPEGLRMISDVANQATRAAILGQDVESAVKNTIVAGAVDFATAKIPGFNELPSAVKNTVKQSINAAVQGKDIDPGTMLANAAKEGVLSYGLNQIPDFKNADPRTQSFISTMLRTAIDQGDLSQAAINFAVNQAQQEFQKTIKAGPALDELKKAGLIPEANYHALDAGQKELVDSFLQQKDPKAAAAKYVNEQTTTPDEAKAFFKQLTGRDPTDADASLISRFTGMDEATARTGMDNQIRADVAADELRFSELNKVLKNPQATESDLVNTMSQYGITPAFIERLTGRTYDDIKADIAPKSTAAPPTTAAPAPAPSTTTTGGEFVESGSGVAGAGVDEKTGAAEFSYGNLSIKHPNQQRAAEIIREELGDAVFKDSKWVDYLNRGALSAAASNVFAGTEDYLREQLRLMKSGQPASLGLPQDALSKQISAGYDIGDYKAPSGYYVAPAGDALSTIGYTEAGVPVNLGQRVEVTGKYLPTSGGELTKDVMDAVKGTWLEGPSAMALGAVGELGQAFSGGTSWLFNLPQTHSLNRTFNEINAAAETGVPQEVKDQWKNWQNKVGKAEGFWGTIWAGMKNAPDNFKGILWETGKEILQEIPTLGAGLLVRGTAAGLALAEKVAARLGVSAATAMEMLESGGAAYNEAVGQTLKQLDPLVKSGKMTREEALYIAHGNGGEALFYGAGITGVISRIPGGNTLIEQIVGNNRLLGAANLASAISTAATTGGKSAIKEFFSEGAEEGLTNVGTQYAVTGQVNPQQAAYAAITGAFVGGTTTGTLSTLDSLKANLETAYAGQSRDTVIGINPATGQDVTLGQTLQALDTRLEEVGGRVDPTLGDVSGTGAGTVADQGAGVTTGAETTQSAGQGAGTTAGATADVGAATGAVDTSAADVTAGTTGAAGDTTAATTADTTTAATTTDTTGVTTDTSAGTTAGGAAAETTGNATVLTQGDVQNIVNSAIAANPGLNVQDVQNVVNQAIAGLPAGLSMADVNTAITDALKTLPASVTPGEMQTAISTAVSDLGTSVTGQIGDLKNSVTAALDAAKSQGLQGDAALQAAIEKVAGDLGTTRESLLSQLGTTEESLRSEFASQLGTATGALAGQIGDVETRLLDKINAAQQSGLKGDAALQSAIDGVAADLGTTRDALLGQIGQTEQSLRTQFETALGGVQTQVQQQATSLANLDARIDALMQQGLDAKTATEAALNELGQTQTKTSTELNSRIDALVQQGVDTRTATQQAINELTTSQQEATSRLDARIDQLIQQGMDQQTATRTAIDELSGQVATTQTQTQTALADVNARINELMQQGVDYQTATQRALTELGGGLGELGKGFQEYVTSQEKARQEEQEAQRKAQQQARSQAGMQQALTALGAAGVAAAPAQDYYAKFKDPFMTKVTADKFVSPLESFLKEVQSPSDVGSFLKSDTTRQPDRIAQEENPMDYFNYGKVQSVDDILRLDQPDSPYGFRRGGIVPAFAGGGALNVVNFAGKPRIDFRHGSAVHGPGDGQSDDIPAMLADGEYVFDAETVSALGNGSTKAGAEALDKMRLAIRKHKRSGPLDSIPPPSKTPLEYLAMGRKKG